MSNSKSSKYASCPLGQLVLYTMPNLVPYLKKNQPINPGRIPISGGKETSSIPLLTINDSNAICGFYLLTCLTNKVRNNSVSKTPS